jgi:hypothetical protein
MDPNQTLADLRNSLRDFHSARRDVQHLYELQESGESLSSTQWENAYDSISHNAQRAAEAAEVLDEWLVNGGFLPDGWQEGKVTGGE